MKAGLNLFSVRGMIRTEEDFLSTAIKLREAGYSYLQYSGAAFDAERIKRVSERSGLPVLAHGEDTCRYGKADGGARAFRL